MPMRLSESIGTIAPADLAICRALLTKGSRSFAAAARLLPRPVRDDATALYAFCRVADDAVDTGDAPAAALAELEQRLDAICAGRAEDHAADRAMAAVMARHAMPRALPGALLEGLAWDAAGMHYSSLADVRAYAARVAGSVGAMMAVVMGVRDRATLARACELGIAMQLTNIARDVGEDARAGRVYLPQAWLHAAGVRLQANRTPVQHGPELAAVVERLLDAAEQHYRFAAPGIAALPLRCRPGVRVAARMYAGIGARLAANGYDAINQRAVVSAPRKLAVLAAALVERPAMSEDGEAPAAAQIAFMLDAVDAGPISTTARTLASSPRWWQLRAQLIWVLELFTVLEQRQQLDKRPTRESNKGASSTTAPER